MSVKIRLARAGRKKAPAYRVVVADSRRARDGRFIEIIGFYQPLMDPPKFEIDVEKAVNWLLKGAIPSDTVRSLFRKAGVLKKFHEARAPKNRQAAQPSA
ncbi:MAG: 30S ribosomal protein S16 [Candidatus Sumerlaeaceae bacterium]|jgi:small subunit ribosomal protein S16